MPLAESFQLKEQIIEQYKHAYKILMAEHDLSPNNPIINETLYSLVNNLGQFFEHELEEEILSDREIGKIRSDMLRKLETAETLMEFYYAEKFIQDTPNINNLRKFIYWDNYKKLVDIELKKFFALAERQQLSAIAFVGSGPLPLSTILLQRQTGKPVVCLDINPAAYNIGKKLIDRYGLQHSLTYVLADGASYHYEGCDLVWIASLVPNKQEVVKRIYETNPNAVVAIRSVDGIYQLLYEPVDEAIFQHIIGKEIGRTKANSSIINSTIFYRFQHV
uniref:Nicotianamine synthase n=1 Tax=Geobacillus sp. (strain Y4.1MC1) TaxID=581103 RepID=A0A7U3YFW0_GEOS0